MMKINLPEYENIPDVGLYLEQVTKYIASVLEPNKDLELTSTMVTNYVKLKIVPKGIKKMYTREQIALFIIIAYSKNILSMNQIKIIFDKYDGVNKTANLYNLFKEGLEKGKCDDSLISSITHMIISKLDLDNQINKFKKKNK